MRRLATQPEISNMDRIFRGLLPILVLGAFLGGCQGSLNNIPAQGQGQKLEDVKAILLGDTGRQTGQYRTDDLTVDWEYRRAGGSLQLSGVVRFSPALQNQIKFLGSFQLGLVLSDAQGNTLMDQGLTTAYGDSVSDPISFSTNLAVPPQAASMAFSYRGQAYGGDGGLNPIQFYEYPVAR